MLTALSAAVLLAGVVHARDQIVGSWCDRMVPNNSRYNRVMTVYKTDDDAAMLRSVFADGSETRSELKERPSGEYLKVGSTHGDRYRVDKSSGNLRLIDNDGLIRVATRIGDAAGLEECQ
jgi:hypothetical protein